MRESNVDFPQNLYRLVTLAQEFVDLWTTSRRGPEKGRAFEQAFCGRCDSHRIPLLERPGSATLSGVRSGSGVRHENDAVVGWSDLAVHAELKCLRDEVTKYDIFALNQKGQDYLATGDLRLRCRPLYRMLVSGGPVSPGARRLALQWGIIVVEPRRVTFVEMFRQKCGPLVIMTNSERAVHLYTPFLINSLQQRMKRFSQVLDSEEDFVNSAKYDRALRAQELWRVSAPTTRSKFRRTPSLSQL